MKNTCDTKQLECKIHGLTEHAHRDNGTRWRCKKCGYEAVSRRRRKLKAQLIEEHGGSCIRCGYNTCIDALVFHHRDPERKEFNVSSSNNIKWSALLEESKKCDLLCANCHAEIHAAP